MLIIGKIATYFYKINKVVVSRIKNRKQLTVGRIEAILRLGHELHFMHLDAINPISQRRQHPQVPCPSQ